MKKLLALLFFVSILAQCQNKGLWKKYVDIPSAPAQTTPHTLVPGDFCCGAGIFDSTTLAGNHQVKTSGDFSSGLSLRNWIGTASTPYVIVNTAGDIYGGAGGSQEGVSRTGVGNFWYLYGLSSTAPMIVKGNNAIQLPAYTSPGGTHIVQNAVGKAPKSAGVTANFDTSAGSYYAGLNITFWRYFGTGVDATSQEGICYLGATHTGFATIANVIVKNCFSYNSAREGLQLEHITLATATHNTTILAGQGGVSTQQNSLQAHDLGPGSKIEYNVFDNSPIAANIFTHGTSISHNYFSFSSAASFIGRTDNSYFAGSANLTGDSLIFDGDYFNYTGVGTLAYVFDVAERTAPIIFRNCTFSTNITAIWSSSRAAGFTNTITGGIGDHGNVSAAITAPVYVTGYNDQDNYAFQGLIATSSPYYQMRFGYRTP